MRLAIEIELDNAAFWQEDGSLDREEVSRILRGIAEKFEEVIVRTASEEVDLNNPTLTYVRDINGNKCGRYNVFDR